MTDESSGSEASIVRARAVEKIYRVGWRRRRVEALRGVDLDVRRGEIVGLLGPNGSGKTTLLRILLGLARADSGEASVLGAPAGERAMRGRLGYLPEENSFHRFLTVEQTLALHGRLLGLDRGEIQRRTSRLLEALALEPGRGPVRGLSKGTVRKMGFAAALMGDPELLILDEPTSGIDPVVSREVAREIQRRRDAGATILLSSHLLSDVESLCDRVVVLYRGQVICAGWTDELLTIDGETQLGVRGLDAVALERVCKLIAEQGGEIVSQQPGRESLESFLGRLLDERGERPS